MHQVSTYNDVPGRSLSARRTRTVRLAYFVSHPIQYQAPLLRRIAEEPDIEMTTYFSTDISVRGGYHDPGFGVRVEWDIPLLDGYKYEFLPRTRDAEHLSFTRPLNWGILSRLLHGRYDVAWVFGYASLTSLNAIFAARLLGIPVILRSDSNLYDRIRSKKTLAMKRMMAAALKPALSSVVTIGEANDRYWKHYMGEDFPTFRMPYAVDNAFFRRKLAEAAAGREALRHELGLEPGLPVILYASKLQTRKRCIDLLEAYIRLAGENGREPEAYLLIVGDGEERGPLEARARESRLSRIRFLGFRGQTELPRFFDLCDIFVLPSVHEPWGLIVNEVMNAARPVVVTDEVGCQPDLVHDGVTGLVYPARNVEALAECLRRLIANPGLRTSMGKNGAQLIQDFSFEADVAGLRQALAHAVPGFGE